MRWNHGVARCARLANSPFGDVLAYSKSPCASLTAKLMSDGCAGDAEPIQQPLEARVVAVVEDDEAGVDPVRLVRRVDPHRVGVAARVGLGLEDLDLVLGREQMRGHEAGDAGADDGDPHDRVGSIPPESAAAAFSDQSGVRRSTASAAAAANP